MGRDWRTVRAHDEQIQTRLRQRVHFAGDPARTGYILGGGHDENDEIYWTVSWDRGGPDRDNLYNYRHFRDDELIPLATTPERFDSPTGEQMSLFDTGAQATSNHQPGPYGGAR
jgi:hypothetical protein